MHKDRLTWVSSSSFPPLSFYGFSNFTGPKHSLKRVIILFSQIQNETKYCKEEQSLFSPRTPYSSAPLTLQIVYGASSLDLECGVEVEGEYRNVSELSHVKHERGKKLE